jgi:hypothetical protein
MMNSTDANNPACNPSLPPFSGTTLEQVLQFVLPEDVAQASIVCKSWRDELKPLKGRSKEDSEEQSGGVVMNCNAIWKQAVTNSSPNVIQAVIAARGGEKARGAEIDFLALAKSGLGRKRKNPELPEPTFRIEDLLIVLEIHQEKVIKDENGEEKVTVESLGAFFHNCKEDMLVVGPDGCGNVDFDLENIPALLLEGQNPLCPDTYKGDDGAVLLQQANIGFHHYLRKQENWPYWMNNPFNHASKNALGKVMVSATLFRCDDWRSFHLFGPIKIGELDYSPKEEYFDSFECPSWGEPQQQSPFARNELGCVAHEVLASKELHCDLRTNVNIYFACALPPSGTTEEPAWFRQIRVEGPATGWSEQHDDEISQVKTFQFRLNSISLSMGAYGDDGGEFDDPKGFLLLLEGLDWK